MSEKITQIYKMPILRTDIAKALEELDVAIGEALDDAVDAGVPLILAKSILETHVTMATIQMLRTEEDDD